MLAACLVLCSCLAAGPADAAFAPARYAVKGKALAPGAGKGVSLHLAPKAVALDGCQTRKARVGSKRRPITLKATVRCGKRTVKLTARVRGRVMRGKSVSGRKVRRFTAKRARPVGVLLKGKRSAAAIRAIGPVGRAQRYGTDGVARVGKLIVARRELIVNLKPAATVGQVNALLRNIGGGITSSVKGSGVVLVGIPDPGSAKALAEVRRRLAHRGEVARVDLSPMAEPNTVPPGIAAPPSTSQQAALSHLLSSGVAAAWNARAAVNTAKVPTVVVADAFGGRALSKFPHLDATYAAVPKEFKVGPKVSGGLKLPAKDHGYHVTGIMLGDFANNGTPAGLVTGAFPARARLVALDVLATGVKATSDAMINALDGITGHAVVNTSLGLENPDGFTAGQLGAYWIGDVRTRSLEDRVVHAVAASNDKVSTSLAGPWQAAAVSKDFVNAKGKPIQLRPLTNTLAVENVTESTDFSRLTCLDVDSNTGGSVAAPGDQVYSFNKLGGSLNLDGTSMASPVIAGLSTYLWSIDPDLTPQQVVSAIKANLQPLDPSVPCARKSAPLLDAYKALLSLDQPGSSTPSGSPVRLAILDLDGDRKFTETDLQTWAPKVDRTSATRDWSRHDLNGDGFTDEDHGKAFDLDRTGSQHAGQTTLRTDLPFPVVGRTLDENSVTDSDILCYYAYSSLYTGSSTRRSELLDPVGGCKATVSTIAFMSTRDGISHEIFTMNSDGTGQLNRTNDPLGSDIQPALSPDGTQIAYARGAGGDFEIYTMNADGTGQVNRTNNAGFDTQPTWSPDGTQIAFISVRNSPSGDIYVMNADGSEVNLINNTTGYSQPAWSPDGTQFAFTFFQDVWTMNADGTGPLNRTNTPGNDREPDWSPDGTRIAYTSVGPSNGSAIFVMNANGSEQKNLTDTDGPDTQPVWSPDGTQIAFTSFRLGNAGINTTEIYVMNSDGSGQVNRTNNPADDRDADW